MAVLLDTDNTYPLSKTFSHNPNIRVREVDYGDGYRVIIEDGINSGEDTPTLNFIPLDSTTSLQLIEILKNSVKSLSNYIEWTIPGETTAKYWTAHGISRTHVTNSAEYYTISCTLRREYLII